MHAFLPCSLVRVCPQLLSGKAVGEYERPLPSPLPDETLRYAPAPITLSPPPEEPHEYNYIEEGKPSGSEALPEVSAPNPTARARNSSPSPDKVCPICQPMQFGSKYTSQSTFQKLIMSDNFQMLLQAVLGTARTALLTRVSTCSTTSMKMQRQRRTCV